MTQVSGSNACGSVLITSPQVYKSTSSVTPNKNLPTTAFIICSGNEMLIKKALFLIQCAGLQCCEYHEANRFAKGALAQSHAFFVINLD